MKKHKLLLGAHISSAGGIYKSVERAELIGCDTMQIFTKSNRTWDAKKITEDEANMFKEALSKSNLSQIMVHAAYLINLASDSKDTLKKSIKALKEEIARCDLLSIPYLVLHPGSHGSSKEEEGLKKVISGLNEVLEEKNDAKILLETAAGQGSSIGNTFEQLKHIYDNVQNKKRLGFCIDTCHIFAAGYDISTETGYKETIHHFEKTIGIKYLHAIHLNDSKKGLASHLDRHEKIGKGALGLKTFKLIVNDKRLEGIPMVLETPIEKTYEEYKEELKTLRDLSKNE